MGPSQVLKMFLAAEPGGQKTDPWGQGDQS